jgi:hypothetical protein
LAIVAIFGEFLEFFWYFWQIAFKRTGNFYRIFFFQNTSCKLPKILQQQK